MMPDARCHQQRKLHGQRCSLNETFIHQSVYTSDSFILLDDPEKQMSGMEIVNEICSILNTEPIPKQLELTILPLEDDNTPFLKEDIYLGIHFPCLPKLSRDFRSIYKSLKYELVDTSGSEHFGDQMMKVLTCLLLVCPDHATAWADRRRCILRKLNQVQQMDDEETLKVLEKELDYLDLLFTQHSKA
jgi:hypothetical protein